MPNWLRIFRREYRWASQSARFDNKWSALRYAWIVRHGRGG